MKGGGGIISNKLNNKFLTIIFSVWFVMSFVFIFISCSLETTNMLLVDIGQLFAIFGVYTSFYAKQKVGIIPFLFGLCLISGVCINIFVPRDILKNISDKYVPIVPWVIFILVGLGMLIFRMFYYYSQKKKCTLEVAAKCCDVRKVSDFDYTNRNYKYQIIWEYYINCQDFSYCEVRGHNILLPRI